MTKSDRICLICVGSGRFSASLILRRVYEALPDPEAESRGLVRVIDESGEDYLYPCRLFESVQLSEEARRAFA